MVKEYFKRSAKLPKKESFFLFGARGTGKTTLIKDKYLDENTITVDLLRSKAFNDYSLNPGLLRNQIEASETIKKVIIDEVQRIPNLLNEVHALIEDYPKIQFILTGSSARKLKRDGANLLAGRAQVHNLFPLTALELGEQFDLAKTLQWGSLPKIFSLESKTDYREFLIAYSDTYLREEILQVQLIRKLEPFQRFLPIAAQMSGKILNYSSISRDVGVASQTVENYFDILTDTLLGFPLPSYHPSIRKQERKASKYFLFDNGVIRSLAGVLESDISPGTSYYGELFEQYIIQEIYRRLSYARRTDKLFYYQSESGLEVDLVITKPNTPNIFIEIKSATRIRDSHIKNLNRLAKELHDAKYYCFSLDTTTQKIDNVKCLHFLEGFKELGLA